jgi:hypothetical protein
LTIHLLKIFKITNKILTKKPTENKIERETTMKESKSQEKWR